MLEVLHLIDTYRIGGPGKTIINSAKYIDQSRYRVHVASFIKTETEPSEFAIAVRAAGIPGIAIPEHRRSNFSHIGPIRRYISAHGIGLLHTHGYRTDVLGYFAVRPRPTTIVTTHHGWIRNNRRQLLFARLALRLCTRFHGVELVSERLRDELPASFRQSERVAVVRNGIVLNDYVSRGRGDGIRGGLGIDLTEVLLGVIGRLSIEKGCLEMLDAYRLVREQRPQARLVFIGEGPLHAQLLSRIRELGLTDHVLFVPHQKEIQPYYEAFDIVVSPSRTEGLSNVILESQAVGRPVVATRVGGNSEILTTEISGLLVDAMNPEQLAAAIIRVIDHPALRAALIRGGAARVREEFAFEFRMRQEERFYEEALRRVRAAR